MNISKLPDDVMKHVESFVDKRPPFADELLNRKLTEYINYTRNDDERHNSRYNLILCSEVSRGNYLIFQCPH